MGMGNSLGKGASRPTIVTTTTKASIQIETTSSVFESKIASGKVKKDSFTKRVSDASLSSLVLPKIVAPGDKKKTFDYERHLNH